MTSTGFFPTTISLTISTLSNPAIIPTDFTWLTSYTSDNFKISENRNTIQFTTFCNFPCKQCENASRSNCLSCYSNLNLTNKIYLHNKQCLAICPSGYIEDFNNKICQACSLPCLTCSASITNCTSCNTTSIYKYLNKTSTGNTCVS